MRGNEADLSPTELLDSAPVHTLGNTARILALDIGVKPSTARRRVLDLVDAGRLRLVDPTVPATRRTISTAELRRYIQGRD